MRLVCLFRPISGPILRYDINIVIENKIAIKEVKKIETRIADRIKKPNRKQNINQNRKQNRKQSRKQNGN